MPAIAKHGHLDSSVALMREGYLFISRRCRLLDADLFETRLMMQKTLCLFGREAAQTFYDASLMEREGAMPLRVQKTLIGRGGVQGLDGAEHSDRKAMLMSLMTPRHIEDLVGLLLEEWRRSAARWEQGGRVVLHDESQRVLCRAVCRWAGVPLPEPDAQQRASDLDALIRGAGAVGPRHWHSRRARSRCERWAKMLIEETRAEAPASSTSARERDDALHVIALHRDRHGNQLEPNVAAVELINVLRPTVALSTYITFAALALHRYPESHPGNNSRELEWFVQEVRRYYPFFPFAAARVSRDFEWRGYSVPKGRRVLLDLYGTCHDARIWKEPDSFSPQRFEERSEDAFTMIPQGGGDHYQGHRCAGEWITISLLKASLQFLLDEAAYSVPAQDLHIDLSTVPTLPASRFVIVAK